ncbi:histidine phosphatase family protein [Paenibacillus sp. NPDC057934]|uniref:histidine phosphatase family protein n=1 Tax=Paenibacillus sp. NPDC057934 TaxID=3346282 RepID=UPI0036DAA207
MESVENEVATISGNVKIGLLRHFKVDLQTERTWMSAKQFNAWVDEYNACSIEMPQVVNVLDVDWGRCLSSNLYRATETAKSMYTGEIIVTDQLREIDVRAFTKLPVKLPLSWWMVIGRLAWYGSHRSQQESRIETTLRARSVIDQLEQDQNAATLLVTHGAFMKVLRKELLRRGYQGESFTVPKNGGLYTFEKSLG